MNNMEKGGRIKGILGQRKAQTTIFIIIAVIVVALAVLIYVFRAEIGESLGLVEKNPSDFIQSCLQDEIIMLVDTLSLQGGDISPEHYIVYNGENINYLCYTNEYYLTCVVQEPMLKQHIEKELEDEIRSMTRDCFEELKENYEGAGYGVNMKRGDVDVELLPKRIVTTLNYSLALTKGDASETHEKFSVILHNNLYELVSITNSIIELEALYGDIETTTYMTLYKDLKVEKKKQTDGTTIYILTDRNTENKFQFASRSVAWPPGYGY
jgi:hypothetical protein